MTEDELELIRYRKSRKRMADEEREKKRRFFLYGTSEEGASSRLHKRLKKRKLYVRKAFRA